MSRTTSAIVRVLASLALLMVAQADAAAQQLQMGARGGITFATVSSEGGDGSPPSFETRTAPTGGVFVTWQAVRWLAVQPELLFTAKGASLAQEGIDARLLLDYLEVPVLARLSRRVSGTNVYLAGGPAVAWRLRAKARTVFSGSTEELDLADDVEPFDLGIVMGGGVEAGRLVADVRYTLGVRDIDADRTDTVSMRNRALSVTVGLKF